MGIHPPILHWFRALSRELTVSISDFPVLRHSVFPRQEKTLKWGFSRSAVSSL